MSHAKTNHRCPIPGCNVLLVASALMCRSHWFMVPEQLRGKILALYRRERGSDAHREAAHEAIRGVAGRCPKAKEHTAAIQARAQGLVEQARAREEGEKFHARKLDAAKLPTVINDVGDATCFGLPPQGDLLKAEAPTPEQRAEAVLLAADLPPFNCNHGGCDRSTLEKIGCTFRAPELKAEMLKALASVGLVANG